MEKEEKTKREREDSLMKYIEDMIREKSTTTRETKDLFNCENKVEQVEASILEIIEESKTNKKIVQHQAEKQKQLSVIESTIDGGKISTKRTKNEVQTKKIETEEKERDQNKFELLVFSVSSSVGSVLDGYQSSEEHNAFKDGLELRQRLLLHFRSVREVDVGGRSLSIKQETIVEG